MIVAIKLMENITAHWQQMQKAFRQGYVMNFRECYYASGVYALYPVLAHPLSVECMFPTQYPEEKLIQQLNAMGARFRLLPSHPNN
jgi:hypothetical protein